MTGVMHTTDGFQGGLLGDISPDLQHTQLLSQDHPKPCIRTIDGSQVGLVGDTSPDLQHTKLLNTETSPIPCMHVPGRLSKGLLQYPWLQGSCLQHNELLLLKP